MKVEVRLIVDLTEAELTLLWKGMGTPISLISENTVLSGLSGQVLEVKPQETRTVNYVNGLRVGGHQVE